MIHWIHPFPDIPSGEAPQLRRFSFAFLLFSLDLSAWQNDSKTQKSRKMHYFKEKCRFCLVNSENSRTFADENNIFVIYKFVKLENIWNSTVEISLQTLEDKFANIRPHFRGYEVQFVALSLGDMWRRGIIGTAQMIRWIQPLLDILSGEALQLRRFSFFLPARFNLVKDSSFVPTVSRHSLLISLWRFDAFSRNTLIIFFLQKRHSTHLVANSVIASHYFWSLPSPV